MNRKRIGWVVGVLTVGIAAMAYVFMEAGRFLVMPSPSVEKSDLIVVLGGGSGNRDDRAVELYAKGVASKILLTGLEGGHARARSHYLNWRAQFLMDLGIPRAALVYDLESASSWEEAVNTLRRMQAENLTRVVVVSDPPHLRRLSWAWGKVFAGSGKEFRLVAAPLETWDAARWWGNSGSALFVIAEYIKLVYYLIQYSEFGL